MKSRTKIWLITIALFAALANPVRLGAQAQQEHEVKHHNYKLIDIGTFGGPSSGNNGASIIMNNAGTVVGFAETLTPDPFPASCVNPDCFVWKSPRRIFVNSMSDLFHQDVPLEYVKGVFDVMVRAHWHQFQALTKRADRLRELNRKLPWPTNVWQGVSIESERYLDRIDDLRHTGAAVKFLSFEPLLEALPNLDLRGIDWVIGGGESGPGARPIDGSWVIGVREKCRRAGVPFFFKQWGGVQKSKTGRTLEGKTWDEMPADPALAIV